MPAPLKIALITLVLTAAGYDFRFRRIPNWLNLSGVVIGLGLNTMLYREHGLNMAVLGLLIPLLVYIPLYFLRAMGAGDAKLMAAVGSIAGPQNWIIILFCTALAGGAIALAVAAKKARLRQTLGNTAVLAGDLMRFHSPAANHPELDVRSPRSVRLPHGVSIAVGSMISLIFPLLSAH